MVDKISLLSGILFLSTIIAGCSGGGDGGGGNEPQLISLPAARNLLPDLAVSDKDFNDAHFGGSGVCSTCHNEQGSGDTATMVDSMGRDLSIGTAWESSLMANSARDPYWHAVLESELHLYPNLTDELNDTCTRCHAPMANEVGRRTGNPIQALNSGSIENGDFVQGFLEKDGLDETFNHAMDGVSCTLCHQIADDGNLGTDASMTGGFFIQEYAEAEKENRPAYGQYTDPDGVYMQVNSEFNPVYGAHLSTSESCATCHNLNTTPVDRQGNTVGQSHFAEQAMYTEWENSDFNVGGPLEQSCQSCHMPVVPEAVPIAGAGAGGVTRNGFAEHTFLGANTVMLDIMNEFREELGLDPHIDFDTAIARNRQFLTTAADLTLLNNTVTDSVLDLTVRVNNNTGHKLPSGYHSRRVFLHVLVTDAAGQVVYENGRLNPDGSIVGVIEDINPNAYEPHYQKITRSTDVQVYQAIVGNSDGEQTHSLLNGTHYLKDNRLTPKGLDKNAAPDDIAVAGAALADGNFNDGADNVSYEIPVSGAGPYNVLVELMYQPLSHGHLMHLFAESDKLDRVDMFRTMYESTTLKAETIAATQGTSN